MIWELVASPQLAAASHLEPLRGRTLLVAGERPLPTTNGRRGRIRHYYLCQLCFFGKHLSGRTLRLIIGIKFSLGLEVGKLKPSGIKMQRKCLTSHKMMQFTGKRSTPLLAWYHGDSNQKSSNYLPLMLRPTLATDIFCYPLEFRTLLVASRANLNLIGRYINNLLFLLYHILVWEFIE